MAGLNWFSAAAKRARPPAVVSPLMLALVTVKGGTAGLQPLSEQGRPALADGDAETGGEAVAVDQNAFFGRAGRQTATQQQQKTGDEFLEHG